MPPADSKQNQKLSDEVLIANFQNGDVEAYNELVRRYKDRLTNFVYRYTGNYDDADDIVQEVFIRIYTSKHLYREIAKFSTWMYTIAVNNCKTRLARAKREKTFSLNDINDDNEKQYDIPDECFSPDSEVNSQYLNKFIQKALDSISETYRELVILRDIENFSYEEISEITGLPMGTVKSRINRGREKLQILLKDIYKDIG
jgi:RNA polymerase sigma-70 factor (ECF subfamily)